MEATFRVICSSELVDSLEILIQFVRRQGFVVEIIGAGQAFLDDFIFTIFISRVDLPVNKTSRQHS